MPEAFIGLFSGDNIGKAIVKPWGRIILLSSATTAVFPCFFGWYSLLSSYLISYFKDFGIVFFSKLGNGVTGKRYT